MEWVTARPCIWSVELTRRPSGRFPPTFKAPHPTPRPRQGVIPAVVRIKLSINTPVYIDGHPLSGEALRSVLSHNGGVSEFRPAWRRAMPRLHEASELAVRQGTFGEKTNRTSD